MLNLKKEEFELLNNPALFYDASKINYNLYKSSQENCKNCLNINSNNSKYTYISIISTYKPCFSTFNEIYKNDYIKLINCVFYKASYDVVLKNKFYDIIKSKNNYVKQNKKTSYSNLNHCLILIHGFKSKNKKIYLQLAERYANRGINCLVYSLPFHFERTFINSKGINFLDIQDFRVTLEIFRQTVLELQVLLKILRQLGFKSIGFMGFSFGGYCCSILGCFQKDVDFLIPMASIGNFESLLFLKKKKISKLRNLNDKSMFNKDFKYLSGSKDFNNLKFKNIKDFNDFLADNYMKLINPISYLPIIDLKRLLFIQGIFDHRAPLNDFFKLRKKWGNPKVVFYPCDHFTFFLFNRLTLKITENFIKSL